MDTGRSWQAWTKVVTRRGLALTLMAAATTWGGSGAALAQMPPQPAGGAPAIPEPSNLPSLSSAHGDEKKCDVLLQWLSSGRTSATVGRPGSVLAPEEMSIFRDESMKAVFGKRYDDFDNEQRIDLTEKMIDKCTGEAHAATRPAPRPMPRPNIRFGGINLGNIGGEAGNRERQQPMPREYAEEFRPYSELLHESFGGRPGRFEPVAITQYLTKVRQQVAWLNSVMSSAGSAATSVEAIHQLEQSAGQINTQASMLKPEERTAAQQYLERRQQESAPAAVNAWLATAGKQGNSLEAAQQLEAQHRQLSNLMAHIDSGQRSAAEEQYNRLLDADIAASVRSETASLHAIPATWQGAEQIAAQEADFQKKFGAFSSAPSFEKGAAEIEKQRERILPAVLPTWDRKVAATPAQPTEVADRRHELQELFPAASDRSSPLYAKFERPVTGKENEMQARAAAEQKREEQARIAAEQKAVAQVANIQMPGPAGSSHVSAQGGEGALLVFPTMIKALYAGSLSVIPDDQLFRSYFFSVFKGIGDECPNTTGIDTMSAAQYGSPMLQAGGGSPVELGLQVLKQEFQMMGDIAQAKDMNGMVNGIRQNIPNNGLIQEGVMDGETVAKTWKCNTATGLKIRASLSRLFEERKGSKPGPSDPKRFSALMSPEYREVLANGPRSN